MASKAVPVGTFLLISLALTTLVLLSSSIPFLLGSACALMLAVVLSGSLREHYRRYIAILLFIAIGVLPLVVDRTSSEAIYSYSSWSISYRGITTAIQVALRAVATCSIMWLLLYIVPIYRLCQALRKWGVPTLLIELIELSYRYINLLLERTAYIKDAQLLRLGYGGLRQKYEHSAMLMSQTFVLAHAEAEYMYEGLQTRQFDEYNEGDIVLCKEHSPNNISVKLQDISYQYPRAEVMALKDVSLDITSGERIVLLGANGAGKSTLMRLLAGLQREQSGLFYLDQALLGTSNKELKYQRRRIALVMQNANHQLFCPSVEDEIAFGLRNSGIEGDELMRRVEQVIECYGLEALRGTPPHLLSEGQKKWVSIAAIMALEPDIILMDEPTACLDCYYTERVMQLAREFCQSGRSVILSTHDMNLALHWANRSIVMAGGQVIYDGDVQALFADNNLLKQAKLSLPYGFRPQKQSSQIIPAVDGSEYRLGLFHNASALSVLIVGGGRGAERKVRTLVEAGAKCIVLAPRLTEALQAYVKTKQIEWIEGAYTREQIDLEPYQMVIAAVGVASVDREVCQDANRMGKLICNVANPSEGNIQFAAQGNKSGIQIAVHTSYALPEVAQYLRDLVVGEIQEEYTDTLSELQQLRKTDKELYQERRDRFIEQINNDWFNRN